MNDNREYLKGLELNQSEGLEGFADYSAFESITETPSYLNFKGLNTFSHNISEAQQEDVLNSLLLAQRAATKAYPQHSEIYQWYTLYFEVLEKLGWLISNKDFTKYKEKSNSFELDKAIITVLQDILSVNQIKILMKSLELIKSLGEDDKRLMAFEKNTQSYDRGNFQLGLSESTNGNLSILGTGFILSSEKNMSRFLFLKFDKEHINMEFAFYRAELVPHEFNKYRDLVKEKLSDSNHYIAALDI